VVELERLPVTAAQQDRNRLVEASLAAIGIPLVRLAVDRSYTAAALASLLGIQSEEG
jgi:hypothetical protein